MGCGDSGVVWIPAYGGNGGVAMWFCLEGDLGFGFDFVVVDFVAESGLV